MGYVCTGCKEKSFLPFDSVALEIAHSSETMRGDADRAVNRELVTLPRTGLGQPLVISEQQHTWL